MFVLLCRNQAAFTSEEDIIEQLQQSLDDQLNSEVKLTVRSGIFFGLANGVEYFIYALLFWYVSALVFDIWHLYVSWSLGISACMTLASYIIVCNTAVVLSFCCLLTDLLLCFHPHILILLKVWQVQSSRCCKKLCCSLAAHIVFVFTVSRICDCLEVGMERASWPTVPFRSTTCYSRCSASWWLRLGRYVNACGISKGMEERLWVSKRQCFSEFSVHKIHCFHIFKL